MKKNFVLLLIILLVGLNVWTFSDNRGLKDSNNQLGSDLSNLEKEFSRLERTNKKLERENENLSEDITDLESDIDSLEAEGLALEKENISINRDLSQMENQLSLVSQNLNQEKAKKIPADYYGERLYNYSNDFSGLSDYLRYDFVLPTTYSLNVFDCSESAAYLEWALEKEGFDAKICVGETPWSDEGYHAWVIVITEDDYRVVIEATALTSGIDQWTDLFSSMFTNDIRGIVYYDEDDQVSVNYYENYMAIYESILDTDMINNLDEWNWWEGLWGFE